MFYLEKNDKASWKFSILERISFRSISIFILNIGGLILLSFFLHIGSMPDLDLSGATATMAAVAIVGILVTSSFAGSTLFAGIVTRQFNNGQLNIFNKTTYISFVIPIFLFYISLLLHYIYKPEFDFSNTLTLLTIATIIIASINSVYQYYLINVRFNSSSSNTRYATILMASTFCGLFWFLSSLISFLTFTTLIKKDSSVELFFCNFLFGWQ